MAKAKKTIVIEHPGALTRKAKAAGMSVTKFTNAVLKKGSKYSAATKKQAQFAKNARSFHH